MFDTWQFIVLGAGVVVVAALFFMRQKKKS